MFKIKITVTLRPSILDPQGKTVEQSLHQLGYNTVSDVRIGKHIELIISEKNEIKTREIAEQICSKLLANPVMEDYSFEINKLNGIKSK